MDDSPIADLFETIYGYRPKKSGTSFELLVAAAFSVLHNGLSQIRANQYVKGIYSKEPYQIDAIIGTLGATEVKDYTERGEKVGRPDVTKLAGALQDLPFPAGIVASATDFSRPAKAYSQATKINPASKPIDLFHVRPSVDADEEGRVRTIVVNLDILSIDDSKGVMLNPVISPQVMAVLQQAFALWTSIKVPFETLHNADGTVLCTVPDLLGRLTGTIDQTSPERVVTGSWQPDAPTFLQLAEHLVELSAIDYSIPYAITHTQIVIERNGTAQLLIAAEDGSVNKLLTDVELRKVRFAEDGAVSYHPHG